MEAEPKFYRAIMVSSTFTDLEAHRREVIDAIHRFGFHANVMEYSGARSDADVIETSLRMVRESAAYICVIGHKYGQTPDDSDRNPKGLSITELEFDEARRLGRPILLFLMGDDHPVLPADVEPDPKKRKKLEAFRKQAKRVDPSKSAERVYDTFASKDEFAKKAAIAVGLQAMADRGSDLPDRAIRDAIARFIDVKPEANQAELTDAIERFEAGYRALEQQLAAITVTDNRVTSLKAAAEAALAVGDLDKARTAYREAAEAARDKAAEPVRTAAELKSAEAEAHLLALDWEAANAAWAEAEAMLAPFDPDAADNLVEESGWRLGRHDELYARAGALSAAIDRLRAGVASADASGDEWKAALRRNNLGYTLSVQGERNASREGTRLLDEAVTVLREALAVLDRADLPAEWATTQNNFGIALFAVGVRTDGPKGVLLLDEAVTAYRDALTVRTRAAMPADWAMTQNNLSVALHTQGLRTGGSESLRLLDEAVTACREALTVRTHEHRPAQWAITQSNLGNALSSQGERTDGPEGLQLLDEAVTAYRDALTGLIRADMPAHWAAIQSSLGTTFHAQGERSGGLERVRQLDQAVTAYRDALTVRTRADMPAQWAETQNNLGLALEALAEAEPEQGRAHLLDAEAALIAALDVSEPEYTAIYHEDATASLAQIRTKLAGLGA
jgi:tetratricopeptide (TPR) repeat protein